MSSRVPNLSLSLSLHAHFILIGVMCVGALCREFSITSMAGSYRRVFQKPLDFEWFAFFLFFYNTELFGLESKV